MTPSQYVILPSIVTEEMKTAVHEFAPAQRYLDAFISAAPDSGLVVCDRTTLQEAADIVQYRINMHFGDNRTPVKAELRRLKNLRNRLSATLEAK